LVLLVLGILVLAFEDMLRVVVGIGFILVGLYIALQNAPAAGGGGSGGNF